MSSRLVVKNLPKKITDDKIREVFSAKGTVTDVQLKYTKDGKFRHFGFVGFKSPEDAQNALNYLNNTFLNSSKIQIELCTGLSDPNKPKSWSKYAADSSAYSKKHGPNEPDPTVETEELETPKKEKKKKNNKEIDPKIQELLVKHKDDPLFSEFMESRIQKNKAVWSNDVLADMLGTSDPLERVDAPKVALHSVKERDSKDEFDTQYDKGSEDSADEDDENEAKKEISDLEYLKMKTVKLEEDAANTDDTVPKKPARIKMPKQIKTPKELFTVKVRGLTHKEKKSDLKQFFQPLKPKSIRMPRTIKDIAFLGFTTESEMKKALIKNRSFLGGKRIFVTRYIKQIEDGEEGSVRDDTRWRNQEDNLLKEESIAESGRIYVRNLSYLVTEDDLEKLFTAYGPTTEVSMPVDRSTRKPKGFALITFVFPEHATKAYSELDGTVFHGRMLHILPGKAKVSVEEELEKDGISFGAKKMLKLKSQSGSSHNWNSLFLGPNAVADVIAIAYNTTKDKVLDTQGSESIAVRLALGETQIVAQTREFLMESGVQLNAFNQASKQRSKTIILVKNLPAKTTSQEISALFQPIGELGRVILPPSGVTAIVEFLEPSEARTAFTRLAYTKFKNLPLYLEWAPFDTFATTTTDTKPSPVKTESTATTCQNKVSTAKESQQSSDDDDDVEAEPDTMLYIKNLNFNTTEGELKQNFSKCGKIHSVSVALKKDPKNPGQMLSMGYGFLQFRKKASAEKALKTMQLAMINGHAVELKRSNRTVQSDMKTSRKATKITKQTGTKILVRNIPFQANQGEVTDLFKTFGELKAVRLPKKMAGTGPHRGFAFVEYETKHDSKRAFEALCQSTHLYGRRLVLEWASQEDNVEDLRKRTADHFFSGPSNVKTLKKGVVDPSDLGNEEEF